MSECLILLNDVSRSQDQSDEAYYERIKEEIVSQLQKHFHEIALNIEIVPGICIRMQISSAAAVALPTLCSDVQSVGKEKRGTISIPEHPVKN